MRSKKRHSWRAGLAAATAVLAACGGARSSPPPPVLPASALAYLPSSFRPLGAADLIGEVSEPGLAHGLSIWGFVNGAERMFQGQSKRLQVVISRTLVFRSPAGAASYVAFVHRHATAQFGAAPTPRPLHASGRRGWVFTLQACACHMASPALVGVASRGDRVTWLEVNGPTADMTSLNGLFARAP